MRVRTFFLIFALLLVTTGALWVIRLSGVAWVADAVFGGISLVTLVFLWLFYRRIMKPFHSIENGMLLLKEQDFSSRLRTVGQYDADRIARYSTV